MKIAIGSKNPVKFAAVKDGLIDAFPYAEFIPVEVNSNVSAQPIGDEETSKGAITRAQEALKTTQADFGVGLEGGVKETEHGMMGTVWCAMVDRNGKVSLGGGLHYHVPWEVERMIKNGIELGKAMDILTKQENTKHKEGAIGILTGGLIDRKKAYESLVRLATTKFMRPELY